MGKVVVIGSFMMDLSSITPRLPEPGETVKGGLFYLGPGGKGSNQAIAARRLGAEVWFVGSLGDDLFGKLALDNFKRAGVHTDFVKIVPGVSTGAALIMILEKTRENAIVVAPGSNSFISIDQVEAALTSVPGVNVVLVQFEIPQHIILHAARMIPDQALFIVNPAPAPSGGINKELLERIDYLVPNEIELSGLVGRKLSSFSELQTAAFDLLERGVRNVIVTLGSRGCLFASNSECNLFPAFSTQVVDTTGAGDAFCGALAYALSRGKTIEDAIKFANAAAAVKITKRGTASAMPYKDEVEQLLKMNSKNP